MKSAAPFRVRELPVVVVATALVSVVPALAAAWVLPPRGVLALVASALLAVVLSTAVARLGAAAWSRTPGARDTLFADLMVWTWVRRRVTERRLARVRQEILDSHPGRDATPLSALVRMGRLLEARDTYTYGHSRRVARHAQTIARGMKLPEEQVELIRQAALLHDIGKIYTPREIIDKPGRLTVEEFAIIRAHPVDGAALLMHLDQPAIVAIIRHHHERLDGKGYPAGLRGDDIPLGARIVAVADTFDALTSARAYRKPQTHKKALAILAAESGTQLDADAVASFARHYSAGRPAVFAAILSAAGERAVSLLASAGAGLAPGAAAAAAAGATIAIGHGGATKLSEPVPTKALLANAPAARTTAAAQSASYRTPPLLTARPAATPTSTPARQTPTAKRRRTGSGTETGTDDGSGTTQAEGTQDPSTATDTNTQADTAPAAAQTTTKAGDPTPQASRPTTTSTSTSSTSTSKPTSTSSQGSGSTTTTSPTTTAPTSTPSSPATPTPTTPTATTPAATPPPATTTPTATTPAVSTPTVRVPAITTPAVTTPAVTIPSVTVPQVSVQLPSVSITLGPHR